MYQDSKRGRGRGGEKGRERYGKRKTKEKKVAKTMIENGGE